MPVARRVLGENDEITLRMRAYYGRTLFSDPTATLGDLTEAVTMLEDATRISRRVMGDANPVTAIIRTALLNAQATLRAREE